MPLFIDNEVVRSKHLENLESFFEIYPDKFDKSSARLKDQEVTEIKDDPTCLYAMEKEMVATGIFDDSVTTLGSDMMTTCHIAVLRCRDTGATALTHFNGSATEDGIYDMVKFVHEIACHTKMEFNRRNKLVCELHLVGGFNDERGISFKLSTSILSGFHLLQVDFCSGLELHLETFCCSPLNSVKVERGSKVVDCPALFGVAVTVATGELRPAVFGESGKGPEVPLRGARGLHCGGGIPNIYRWQDQRIVIEPFTYSQFNRISLWLQQSDSTLKKHMSTSPDVEPPNFAANLRQTLRFIEANPDPLVSVFKDYKALEYSNIDGQWKRVEQS